MSVNPAAAIRVSQHLIPAWNATPNTSIQNKPLLIYHAAFQSDVCSASHVSAHLKRTDVVVPQWQYTMYKHSHFHSTTHEVLSVVSGRARLCFGGEANPRRIEPLVETGDVIIVPAGVAHRLLEDKSGAGATSTATTANAAAGGFVMVGSYPKGKSWDMCYGGDDEDEDEVRERISQLGWFEQDPIYGSDGPVIHV